jgi:CRP-like cAMP-binding protein
MNLVLNILKAIPLFQTLTEEEYMSMVQKIVLQYFPAHYVLFEKGVIGNAMYIIKSGTVRIFDESNELATLNEGDFFGEMALIESSPRMASAETLSDTEIFVLSKEDFAALMHACPGIAEKVELAYKSRKDQNLNTKTQNSW